MALGKPRSARRSSSSSSGYCSSTITMLVFIVFCVLALWMLTSSSFPSHTNTSTTTRTSKSNSNPNSQIPKLRNKESPVFPDTQGDLPDDAIKGDISDHKSVKETIMDTARDPEVTAAAEQVGGKNDDDKDKEGDNKDLNVDVKDQQSESEGNDNAGKIEETRQAKEEAANEEAAKEEENQNQAQKEEESKEAQQAENTQINTEEESKETQQEESRENTQQNQQENAQQNQQQETESTGQTEQTTETENQESTQQTENQQETDSSETTQQVTENQQQNSIQEVTNFEQQQQQQLQEDAQQQPQTTTEDQTQQQTTEESTQAEETNQNDDGSTNHDKASGIPKELTESKESWSTQENQSENQKERRKEDAYVWELCNVTAGADFIPCLDNEKALEKIHGRQHYEHRERHCPEEGPTCLVPLPSGYKKTIEWPKSRDKIWYHNVPHTKLAQVKGHQNWVKVTGEFLTFPGGGTQFIHGALHYIDFIEKTVPSLAWGKRTRVILDVGCGVASFGGFLFDRDVLTMSFAPKDEHEAQVQFALERGIPAISAVMGTQRLLFPGRVFDVVHCARCRVPWHIEGGKLLLELNRVLRPGGFFVWSATPVYQNLPEDVEIWKAMSALTKSMCWELVKIDKDRLNGVGAAIYRKPVTNECYENRKHKSPPMCKDDDDANAAWYVPLQACLHKVPTDESERGARWPEMWPARVHRPPYWLSKSQKGIYGKSAPDDFVADYEHWKQVTTKTYMGGLDISWSNVRNVMDMRAVYGGFAAALKDLKVWVMNVVNVDGPDTLPIIFERGLFGIYHDWCESFSTYPRTYDLLHADHLFSSLQKRCNLVPVIAEVDRIVRPGGKFIVRDEEGMIVEIEAMLKSLHWEIHLTSSKDQEGILSAVKTDWRPQTFSASF